MKISNCGLIMLEPNYTKEEKIELETEGVLTTIYIVSNIEMACKSAKKLTQKGVHLIELCGSFKDEMVTKIIDSVEGKIPVGNMGMRPEEHKKLMNFLKK